MIVGADSAEVWRDFGGETRLDQGEDAVGVADDVGIVDPDGVVDRAIVTDHPGVRLVHGAGLHVAVAVPRCSALIETDPVQHPVAHEPVPGPAGVRVRTVPQIEPMKLRRQQALDHQLVRSRRDLLEHRRIVATKMEREFLGGLICGVSRGPTVNLAALDDHAPTSNNHW